MQQQCASSHLCIEERLFAGLTEHAIIFQVSAHMKSRYEGFSYVIPCTN